MKRLPLLVRKLLRDLWRTRYRGATVALLLALGVGLMVAALGMRGSLVQARDQYYAEHRLADLQLSVVRAPRPLLRGIEALPGVQAVSGRVVARAIVERGPDEAPVGAHLVSIDDGANEPVNRPWRVAGRWPDPSRSDEVLVNEAFAMPNGLRPGDTLPLLLRGRRTVLTVVGIANAPDFVFVSPPGELFPQPERFAVLWMPRRALEQASGQAGAFNELLLRLAPGAPRETLARRLEARLAPYGAGRAQGRDRLPSVRFLDQEIDQLATMAALLPPAFLAVGAFLLNIVLGRLVEAERANIGLMKAFGYSTARIGAAYAGFALALALAGSVGGLLLGHALGTAMAGLYLEVYRLPALPFLTTGSAVLVALAVAFLAAGAGTAGALRRIVVLAPALALAPPAPRPYTHGRFGREGLYRHVEVPARMVLRRLLGAPWRSLAAITGIACAVVLLVVSSRMPLAVDRLLSLTFSESKRQDVSLSLVEPQGRADVLALTRLPGVLHVEPFRYAGVVYSAHGIEVNESLTGLPADARLERLVDVDGRVIPLRDDGLVITEGLARALGVGLGDRIALRFTEGRRREATLRVVGIARVSSGLGAYLALDALQALLGEPGLASGVHARLDTMALPAFHHAVHDTPALAGVSHIRLAERSMRRIFDEGAGQMTGIFIGFAMLMAAGIAYATASVTLAEQRADLATLKVLGLSNRNISALFASEVLLLAVVALPLGVWLGHHAATAFLDAMGTEIFTFPEIHDPLADLRAALIVLAAVVLAVLLVRRSLDRIDLVESLKCRE